MITHDPLPEVWLDIRSLILLFQNLVANAIKYRSQQALHVHISAEPSEEDWIFSVRDNGIGIAPAYHARIFGIFKRLHGKEIPGTGIGLAICHRIIDWASQLCMHEERQTRFGDEGKRGLQLLLVDHGEAVAAGIDKEALEAADSGAREGEEMLLIVRDGSAPRGPVDETLALGCHTFFFQCCDGGSLRQAVERHVDQRRVATGRGCSCGGTEALPVGASRLIDVDVGIYETR